MHIIPDKLFMFPIDLVEFLNEKKVNIIFWVPSLIILLANLNPFNKIIPKYLKKVLFCGEAMPNSKLNIWRKYMPNNLYANLYGPTEITDVCAYYIVNREFNDNEDLPIGKPCKNTDIIILDSLDKEIKKNNLEDMGEICVRGSSLSMGYYKNKEKTDEVFVQNPLNSSYNELIYRTGDLGKYNEYGEILFCGRKDFQIKHMGHRIELGEIETNAVSINGVYEACCIYDEKNQIIILIYTGDIKESTLKEQLKTLILDYMIPKKIIKLDVMPKNLNGKIHRKFLQKEYIRG